MKANLSKVLDECIARIEKGETIETCLTKYPHIRKQLEPLLHVALSLSTIPEVSPSEEFRKTSKARLLDRIRQESLPTEVSQTDQVILQRNNLAKPWQELWHTIIGARKIAIPATVALVLVLLASILLPGGLNLISPPPAMASLCTLSTLGGTVEIQEAGSDSWQPGSDGMTLAIDTNIKTAQDAHALLTFFEGSTIKLEPDTLVAIQQMEHTDEESITIVVKQFIGRTWTHMERTSTGSYYNIETPAASVVAHGTLFSIDVDETGLTKVAATEGLVSVTAQSEEVYLTASQQTQVKVGAVPSRPQKVPEAKAELLITTDMSAIGSVRDPSGSSTGYLPSGLSFNQITGSKSSLLDEGGQTISIAQPVTGEYVFTLRYITQAPACFNIVSKSEGKVLFDYSEELSDAEGEGWLVRINLDVDDGEVVSCTVVGIEPLGETAPEKIVVTELAGEIAVPFQLTPRDKDAQDDHPSGEVDDGDTGDSINDGNTHNNIPDTDTGSDTGDGDTYDSTRDKDTGGDTSGADKNDYTVDSDTGSDTGSTDKDSNNDSSDDTEPGDNVGTEDAGDNTGNKETPLTLYSKVG